MLAAATWDHDACGVGLIADRHARPSHEWLTRGLEALTRLTHRGATGDGHGAADGAGVLTAIPWTWFETGLPAAFVDGAAARAAGTCFLPAAAEAASRLIAAALEEEGWGQLVWREVPIDASVLATAERASRPQIRQVFALHQSSPLWTPARQERSLYRARVSAETRLAAAGFDDAAIVSLSTRTIVYKALVAPVDLVRFYADLADPRYKTTFTVFHQRFSTNTFPQWALAQPFRTLAHNGEINTILGNRLTARRRQSDRAAVPDLPAEAGPLVRLHGSDSQSLDDMIEYLRQGGFSLAHAFARVLPRAWEHDPALSPRERAFEAYQSTACEPWEGPAAIAFADGRQVGAVLDRNGFRPARVLTSTDGLVCVGSESGIFDIPEPSVERRGRLGPGELLVVDLETGRLIDNTGVRRALAAAHPYREWLHIVLTEVAEDTASSTETAGGPFTECRPSASGSPTLLHQRLFGYTAEEIELIMRPMVEDGKEAIGSMGDDTPLAVLSSRRRLLSDYFRQRFAQVTNPPIDPLRERSVMSLRTVFGRRGRLLDETALDARLVVCESPILTPGQLEALRTSASSDDRTATAAERRALTLSMTFDVSGGVFSFRSSLEQLTRDAVAAVRNGVAILVLSDREVDRERAPLPALLATSVVSQALDRAGLGTRAGLVIDSGEVRDAHQAAALLAFGASALCPWLAYTTAQRLAAKSGLAAAEAVAQYREALQQGVLKTLSKMGVCTIAAYQGSHLMEIVGLHRSFVDACFSDTPAITGAVTLEEIATDCVRWHRHGASVAGELLPHHGFHGFRRDGDYHAWNPALVKQFHHAVEQQQPDAYARFAALVHDRPAVTIRDLLDFVPQSPVVLDAVEPVEQIWTRFFASAMSVGALGPEAHRTLAAAMNRIGARSNSGEGGEDPARYEQSLAGDWGNSATKQVASARFGVTPAYLLSAGEIQIKMAQGSKPGEGGQIPASKVVDHIAHLRRAPPHTALISPPPHHDIYSIEDLAELIYDLRSLHPAARINVKLVATSGVGIIAAGVVKAGADAIQISGHDGGTGASPRGSIKHAGLPWEAGLFDAHQVLVARGSRHRVVLQTDGGLKTGRDVAMAAALGAQEYGFGTAALVAIGCVMARQCHLNSCPAGIATQKPELRAKYAGTPDQVVAYLRMVAEDVRHILASLGLRSLDALVGRTDLLRPRDTDATRRLDLDVFVRDPGSGIRDPEEGRSGARLAASGFRQEASATLNAKLLDRARDHFANGMVIREVVRNTDRAVGATLAGAIARAFGDAGLPGSTIRLELTGSAGQSLGAFGVPGLEIAVTGDANDGVAKSLCGGTVSIAPPRHTPLADQVLIGNAALYGATGGRLFVAGRAGERFAVRNSGAIAVVEGVGHHGCEYMTNGTVVVLGATGLNFAAGMTGGVVFAYDPERALHARLNDELVIIGGLSQEDEAVLRQLLIDHRAATDSALAARLLASWPDTVIACCRVTPKAANVVIAERPLAVPEQLRA